MKAKIFEARFATAAGTSRFRFVGESKALAREHARHLSRDGSGTLVGDVTFVGWFDADDVAATLVTTAAPKGV